MPRPDRLRRVAGLAWRGADESELQKAVCGRVALVTGASSGIGAETALLLANSGATVLGVARRTENLVALSAMVHAESEGEIIPLPADLTDPEQIKQLIAAVIERGPVDIVVNNAGKSIRRPLSMSYDRMHDFDRTMAINYSGPVQLLLGLLPPMRERGSGHIINISTIGIDLPAPRWAAYTASKGAFETWFQCMAPEVRADGVRATSIHFGLVHTPMSAPTKHYRNKPGMSAAEAAAVIGRAVVDRPRVIRPWWAHSAAVLAQVFPAWTDLNQTIFYRVTRAQAKAQVRFRGKRHPDAE